MDNLWLGGNELVIIFRDGRHAVLEAYEEYETVYAGTYSECVEYVNERYTEYLESLF